MTERKFLFVGGFGPEEMDPTTDSGTLAGLTISTSAGINMSGFKITSLATPTAGSDAVNKNYVDALVNGLDWKASVRVATNAVLPAYTPAGTGVGHTLTANANGALTIDGILVVAGDSILIKDEGSSNNGIYAVTQAGSGITPFILTRRDDCDTDAEVTGGLTVWVNEGTNNADTGWTLTTNDPIVVDTTTLLFTQSSSTTSLTYGAGLLRTGSVIDVELDTAAAAQTAGSGGGSSGLEFDIAGASGKLRAAVNATSGIQRTGTGLGLLLDNTPTTLSVSASGLKVTGLPSLFTINNVAVSANVTSANLGTLTGGAVSTADTLHRHGRLEASLTVSASTTLGSPVYYSGNDQVAPANAAAAGSTGQKVIGVARTTQATIGLTSEVVFIGACAGVLTAATAGAPYWLAVGGGLTATQPTGNVDVTLAGYAINATDLFVRIQFMARKIS